jgi:hypothetical protein
MLLECQWQCARGWDIVLPINSCGSIFRRHGRGFRLVQVPQRLWSRSCLPVTLRFRPNRAIWAWKCPFLRNNQVKIDMLFELPAILRGDTIPSGDCAGGNEFSPKYGFSLTGEFVCRYHSPI